MAISKEFKCFSILYVDDEEVARKYFSRRFSDDFNVITSDSVDSARKILDEKNDEIAVLLTDQRMPDETGVKLLKYAREQYPLIMRLLTTAYTDIDDAIEAVNSGEIYRYITKPWDLEKLTVQLYNAIYVFQTKRYEQDLLKEKRRAMFQFSGNLANELSAPLLNIKLMANGVIYYLPQLIEAYRETIQRETSLNDFQFPQQQGIHDALVDIINEVEQSLTTIDMMMENAKIEPNDSELFTIYSMRECVIETLQRFTFKDGQEEKVFFEDSIDFLSRGSSRLMRHVFINLLNNALFAIAANANKGNIHIRLVSGGNYNLIYFRDTASGISPLILPHIFEDFYSTKKTWAGDNIGLGLTFCKHTIDVHKGSIECDSEDGHYTEFIIKLPTLFEHEVNGNKSLMY